MALTADLLLDTRRAFDGVAETYAESNERNVLLRDMRARVLSTFLHGVEGGSHVLDLGCGPGTDDELLARCGYRVTAIDWSPAMVAVARHRMQERGVADRVEVHNLGIEELERLTPGMRFDAALSDFGPLNCVEDLSVAAANLAARLKRGGVLVASVIGRVCPWELAVYLLRGNVSRALVRLSRGPVAVPMETRTVWTQYYTPAEFEAAFASAGWTRVALEALGVVSPPPYLEAFAARHPRLVWRLQRLDERIGTLPPFRAWGDHFLIVLRRA